MKKIFLINLIIFFFLFFYSCGKKNNTETKVKDESKIEMVEYKCGNMHCASCETTISEAVKKLIGIKEVTADSKNKIVKVSFNKELTNQKEIEKTINDAGYDTETSKSGNKHNCDME